MNKDETYKEIEVNFDFVKLKGNFRSAKNSKGIILFSHGSGSSRLSTRNNFVANLLQKQGFSSLLVDLLTPQEDMIYENRFDIDLLTDRLLKITVWLQNNEETKELSIGYFGASTGAASALRAAAKFDNTVKAIVSRGGRPDLAMSILKEVKTPTLLIVGSLDNVVIELNEIAKSLISGVCELKIIEGATHLFPEPGALEKVAKLAGEWFDKCLNKIQNQDEVYG